MLERRRNTGLRIKRLVALLTALTLLLAGFYIYVDIRLRGISADFAKRRLNSILNVAVNSAARELLDRYSITYDKMSVITRDLNNNVTSIEINTNEINRFKSELTKVVSEKLRDCEQVAYSVPISAAFGIYYSYMSFPSVHYTMAVATAVSTDFKNEFYDAGINQVLHRITVDVSLNGSLATQEKNRTVTGTTGFTVAETVIVGDVPDAYTKIDYANEDIVDDVFDYGAEVIE